MGELLSGAIIYDMKYLTIVRYGMYKVELAERKPSTLGGPAEGWSPKYLVQRGHVASVCVKGGMGKLIPPIHRYGNKRPLPSLPYPPIRII